MKRVVGSCNSCGLCCQLIALPIPHAQAARRFEEWVSLPRLRVISDATRQYFDAHGVVIGANGLRVRVAVEDPEPVRVGQYNGHLVTYIRSRCAQLTDDNRCRLHGRPEQPAVCAAYPTVEDDLACVTPGCGYAIEEVSGA